MKPNDEGSVMSEHADTVQRSPLRVYCQNCGAPANFDIVNQTYRCPHCGETSGIQEAHAESIRWRELHKQSQQVPEAPDSDAKSYRCSGCGALVTFPQNEASETCDFCGSKLMRSNLASKNLRPELVIPFYLTPDEARQRMIAWAKKHSRTPEGKAVLSNMDKFMGYYLPYQLVRGPVQGSVTRDDGNRMYHCAGFAEGIAVNASEQLDNLVLNDIEPFDWTQARPYESGFVAGCKVKLPDLSDKETNKRVVDEVTSDFLPVAERTMQTTGIDVRVNTGDMMTASALLPVYFISCGDLTAAMNGQTGRIAVTLHRTRKTVPWVIEPLIYTILLTALLNFFVGFDFDAMVFRGISVEMLCYSAAVFACIMFSVFGDRRRSLIRRITLRGKSARATRENGTLLIEESGKANEREAGNTLMFFETDKNGVSIPVKIRFYTPWRVISMILRSVVLVLLPLLIATFLRWASMGEGEQFMDCFVPVGGAAWYVLAGFVVIIYWAKGVRRNVYDHPILYGTYPDGKQRLVGSRASRRVGFLSMLDIGNKEPNGKRRSISDVLWRVGGMGIAFIIGTAVILLGSVAAIITP